MAVTGFLSRIEVDIPSRWNSVFDSLRVSSKVLHSRLSVVDEEVEKEFRELEEFLDDVLDGKNS